MTGFWFGNSAPERLLIDLGPLQVYWYSLLVVLGIVAAAAIARMRYRRDGGGEQDFIDLTFYAIIGGIIGARLWHVFVFHWDYYSTHLSEILKIWEGGIAIQGALLGGAVALFLAAFRKRIDMVLAFDSIAIGIPLGQAIGRWGNFFNQELYGKPTDLPWGIFISPENRIPGYESVSHFHPTFLYESLLNLLLFFILWQWTKKHRLEGSAAALYIIGYSIIRFGIDFLRIDPMLMIGSFRSSQLIALAMVIVAVGFWIYRLQAQSVAK